MYQTPTELITIQNRNSIYTSAGAPLNSDLILYHIHRISVQSAQKVLQNLHMIKSSRQNIFQALEPTYCNSKNKIRKG
jgi:hypothetical protein